jgi:hypothetical protein
MKSLKTGLGSLGATIAIFALPAAAPAAYYVPPENSAATQYTESFPTAGGDKESGKGGKQAHRSPDQVLGKHNAEQLEAQGPQGEAAAEVAAETAPLTSSAPTSGSTGAAPQHQAQQGKHSTGRPGGHQTATPTGAGSSGFGQVVGQAVGASSADGIDALLPLAIVGTIAWALTYLFFKRRRQAA